MTIQFGVVALLSRLEARLEESDGVTLVESSDSDNDSTAWGNNGTDYSIYMRVFAGDANNSDEPESTTMASLPVRHRTMVGPVKRSGRVDDDLPSDGIIGSMRRAGRRRASVRIPQNLRPPVRLCANSTARAGRAAVSRGILGVGVRVGMGTLSQSLCSFRGSSMVTATDHDGQNGEKSGRTRAPIGVTCIRNDQASV